MPVALHHIQRYLDQDGPKCQIEYLRPEEDAFVVGPRPPSSLMSAKVPEKNNENNNNEDKKGHTKPYGEEEMVDPIDLAKFSLNSIHLFSHLKLPWIISQSSHFAKTLPRPSTPNRFFHFPTLRPLHRPGNEHPTSLFY
jgi:hypothetical protein